MGSLIGKLKKDKKYHNITTIESGSLYGANNNMSLVEYDCRYKLEDDEWFKINQFSRQDYGDIVNHVENTTNFNQLVEGKYREIEYLIFIDNDLFYFEKITNAKVLQKKVLNFSDEPVLEKSPKVITLNNKPDAIYDKENDILRFKNLSTIKDIFNSIEELYKEATDEETEEFMTMSCISLGDKFTITDIKPANRKRITMAWQSYQSWDKGLKDKFIKYARKYRPDIKYDDDKFVVTNEKELKNILYAMDERYYTTELQKEKRLANSVQALNVE